MQRFEWIDVRSNAVAAAAGATTVATAMVAPSGQEPAEGAIVVKAGGIDLLDLMKEGLLRPRRVVNLRQATGMDGVRLDESGELHIGALTTLAQVAEHAVLRERYPALADAARVSASPQIRAVATLGGNLLQRPRCWYFRSAAHHCARKGGTSCFAFAGENQYHAIFDHQGCAIVHPSTAATALVALGAKVALTASDGIRRDVLLEHFLLLPSADLHRENDLRPGEILTEIVLPALAPGTRSVHLKQGEKDDFDWPLADVAVVLRLTDGNCESASIILGAAAPVPHRAKAAEAVLAGKRVNETSARAAAQAALDGAMPLSKNAYKLPLFATLVRRAILAAAAGA